MNFDRTEYNNSFLKSSKYNFFRNRIKEDNTFQKLTPSFSITNSHPKNKKNPLFLGTSHLYFSDNSIINNRTNKSNKSNYTKIKYGIIKKLNPRQKIQIKKIKLKKSFSEIFQNNDIDFVRNLNIDSLTHFRNNLKLKENLNSLSQDYFQKPAKKVSKIFFDINNDNNNEDLEEQKNKNEILPMLDRNKINKSFKLFQAKTKELKLELSELAQKEVINQLKLLKKEIENSHNKKKEFFQQIKEIDEEIEEINEENEFLQDFYLKEINNLSKDKNNKIDLLDEIIKFKIKLKLYGKNKDIKERQSFLHILSLKYRQNKSMDSEEEQSPKNKKESFTKIENKNKNNQDFKRLESFEQNLKKSNKKKKYDNFMKEQNERMDKLKEDKKDLEEKIKQIELEIDKNKKEEKIIVDQLMMSYKESLYKGTNVKSEGLVWIIKAIWNLGENVPMSFMPNFLDCESVDYLFKLAKKQNALEALIKKRLEDKIKLKKKVSSKSYHLKPPEDNEDNEDKTNEIINNNKSLSVKAKLILRFQKETKLLENSRKKDIYRDLVKKFKGRENKFEIINMPELFMIKDLENQIEKTREEISELKKNEINRIIKCFIEKNYENIYHTNIETVLAALIGADEKDTEINRYNLAKKNYLASMKQVRFYSHNNMNKYKY